MVQYVQTYHDIPVSARKAIVAIGNFDGVHKGHQALLSYVIEKAKRENRPSAVLSFNPHPRRFFNPAGEPFRLVKENQKKRLFESFGLDYFFDIPFDTAFASLSAQDFIDNVLVQGLDVLEVVIGEDFRFGHERMGTVDMLHQEGLKKHFAVTVFEPVRDKHNYIYSSTIIREKIRNGEMEEASKLLGWEWEIEGEVIHGDKRGRTIGYPTINMNMEDYVRPKYGVYAVQIQIEGESGWKNGVANIGIRPMFETPTPLCETFIFDFSAEVYGRIARVKPLLYLRKEMRFNSLEELIARIAQDEQAAKSFLAKNEKNKQN